MNIIWNDLSKLCNYTQNKVTFKDIAYIPQRKLFQKIQEILNVYHRRIVNSILWSQLCSQGTKF